MENGVYENVGNCSFSQRQINIQFICDLDEGKHQGGLKKLGFVVFTCGGKIKKKDLVVKGMGVDAFR